MLMKEDDALSKWCPMVRIEGANRLSNMRSDGFENAAKEYHCIGSRCMSWREFHLSHMRGGEPAQHHGYCGLAGRPELD